MIDFDTPLAYVEFWVDGEKHHFEQVDAREVREDIILLHCVDGSYHAISQTHDWQRFSQSPGASFF